MPSVEVTGGQGSQGFTEASIERFMCRINSTVEHLLMRTRFRRTGRERAELESKPGGRIEKCGDAMGQREPVPGRRSLGFLIYQQDSLKLSEMSLGNSVKERLSGS